MLSKVGKTLKSWVVGDSDRGLTTKRKRPRDESEDEDDVIVTHTKRSKLSNDGDGTKNSWPISKFAEWIVRSRRSFEESYYVREFARRASPRRLIEGLKTHSSGTRHINGNRQHSQSGSVHPQGTYVNMDPGRGWCPPNPGHKACPTPPVGTSPSQPPPAPHHAPPRAGSNAGSPQTKTGYVDLPQTKTGYVDLPQTKTGYVDLPQTKTGYVDLPQTKTGYVDLPYPFVFPPDVIWTQEGQFKMPAPKPPPGVRPMDPHGMRLPPGRDPGLRPSPHGGNMSFNGLPRPPVSVARTAYQSLYEKIERQRASLGHPAPNVTVSRPQNKLSARESIRMDEKQRYAQLIQQFTNVPLSETSMTHSHLRRDKKTVVSQRDRTVLGTDISHLKRQSHPPPSSGPETPLQEVTPRPRLAASPDPPAPTPEEPHHPGLTERSYNTLQQRRYSGGPADQIPTASASFNRSTSRSDDVTPCTWRAKKSEPQRKLTPLSFDDDSPVIVLDSPSSSPIPRSPVVEEFERSLRDCRYTEDWLNDVTSKFSDDHRKRDSQIQEEQVKLKYFAEKREEWEKQLELRVRHKLKLSAREPAVEEYEYVESSSSEEEQEEEEDEFPELSDEQEGLVNRALRPQPAGEVLAEGFRLQIRRSDMDTLRGLNWLNDEIVNFYFELLRERGKQDDFPSVHVFNTFFYPKVKSQGQQGVRRWTKSVDIYTFDYIAIPIHLGMHWCLAVIDFKKKAIRYFDSMGGKNMECLNLLKKYLVDEHQQKKGSPYDTSDWTLENVTGLPQQMNGSDCGVFTCKYADYVTRSRPVSFTQANMPYFRRRMVYEIISKKLMS